MKTIWKLDRVRLTILLGILCLARPCWAIDPLPPEIRNAPIEQQAQYRKKIAAESIRARAQVAKQRYEEKQEYRRAMAAEMDRQLNLQREIMIAQSNPATESSSEAGALSEIVGAGFSVRLWTFALLAFVLFLLYRFRDSVFQRGQKDS